MAKKRLKTAQINITDGVLDDPFDGSKQAVNETWCEFKDALKDELLRYDDINKVKEFQFIKTFDYLMKYEFVVELLTVDLKPFSKGKHFYRAARIKNGENVNLNRFVPDASKMERDNRFSPIGVEWLYLGYDRYAVDAKRCCYNEIRANEFECIKYCEFGNPKDYKIINLTIADDKDDYEILIQKFRNPIEVPVKLLIEVYCKILSVEIFKPINDAESKEIEYKPFQAMAKYFQDLGFNGIIYSSTVSEFGKNIVIFDKEGLSPIELR